MTTPDAEPRQAAVEALADAPDRAAEAAETKAVETKHTTSVATENGTTDAHPLGAETAEAGAAAAESGTTTDSPLPPLPSRRNRHTLPPIPSTDAEHEAQDIQETIARTEARMTAANEATATSETTTADDAETSRPSAEMAPVRRLPSSLSSSSIDDPDINTIPDPRKRAPRGPASPLASARDRAAEDEVTALSTKLIDAINYQTTLDDTLSRTRLELEQERDKVRQLEALAARQKEFLAGGLWVRRSTVEEEKAQILARAREDRRLRVEAEEAKKRIEHELETLTAELFEQANKMVSAAKEEAQREQQAAARRYDNLKAQLADTEGLLRSQQEQLAELKQVMEEMISAETADARSRADEAASAVPSALPSALPTPSSPSGGHFSFDEAGATSTSTSGASTILAGAKSGSSNNNNGDDSAAATDAATTTTTTTATKAEGGGDATTEGAGSGASSLSPATTTTTQTTTTTATTAATLPTSLSAGALPLTDSLPLLPSPSSPLTFQLLRPVLRHDTAAYFEFVDLVRAAQLQLMLQQNHLPLNHERTPSSTSLPKTPPMGASPAYCPSPGVAHAATTGGLGATLGGPLAVVASAASSSSLSGGGGGGGGGGSNYASPQNHVKDLKESKYYKRVLVEDIEPTLRLDTAPGISWLARRSIVAAVVEGTLVAEPVPNAAGTGTGTGTGTTPGLAYYVMQSHCALCGESRPGEAYLRRHRFRLTESDKSTPYPLCGYCLGRVRSVCGFLVFLRMIVEGHWRASDEEAEQAAWEECVRLRELMFWARIGGGVLPAHLVAHHGGSLSSSAGAGAGAAAAAARHVRGSSGGARAVSGPAGLLAARAPMTTTAATTAATTANGEETTMMTAPGSRPTTPAPKSNLSITTSIGDAAGNGTRTNTPVASRTSKLTAMAALVSGMGGHVA